MTAMGICRLCGGACRLLFEQIVLGRHRGRYEQCGDCGLTQVSDPHWLAESYASALSDIDTGAMERNLYARRILSVFLHLAGAGTQPCLDWAGGWGTFTRLMRDVGFDFYWSDPYATNHFARGFEWPDDGRAPFACTAFEVLEHLVNPTEFFREIAARSPRYVVTSTELVIGSSPSPQWLYLAPETGQHVAFYRADTIAELGRRCGYGCQVVGPRLQLFARTPLPSWAWRLANLPGSPLWPVIRRLRPSLIERDSRMLRARIDR